jgi:Zn-dependent M28 family amino/carboxypeptidase
LKSFVLTIVILGIPIMSISCGNRNLKPDFSGHRAFEHLTRQTDLGPRNPGSAGWQSFQGMLAGYLDSIGVEYETQEFDYYDYMTGDTIRMVNWVAYLNKSNSKRIMVCAHYDCRPWADSDPDSAVHDLPILGANDGASGVAVLMHLAETMVTSPPAIGVDLVFFDGEDYGPRGRIDQYLLGSAHFAHLCEDDHYDFALLLDMVGDKDLQIYRETFSDKYAREINDKVWNAAARLGMTQFIDSVRHEIMDDHLSLIPAGIPTADIIDFDYPYWHTLADTPDKCDPASLEAVGKVVLEVIYGE